MPSDVETAQDLLKEPHVSVFLETLYEQLMEWINFVHHMESENELYAKIQQTANKYINAEEQYDKSEAFKKAWLERKIAIMDMLSEHEKVINEALTDETNETNDSQPPPNISRITADILNNRRFN